MPGVGDEAIYADAMSESQPFPIVLSPSDGIKTMAFTNLSPMIEIRIRLRTAGQTVHPFHKPTPLFIRRDRVYRFPLTT